MPNLFVIDDNIDLVKVLREALELSGYQVTEAHDGEGALKLLDDGFAPAAILCDITLPHMDGLELLQQMRANPILKDCILIAMSGSGDKRKQALDAGADHYLVKPFSFQDLYAILPQEEPPE